MKNWDQEMMLKIKKGSHLSKLIKFVCEECVKLDNTMDTQWEQPNLINKTSILNGMLSRSDFGWSHTWLLNLHILPTDIFMINVKYFSIHSWCRSPCHMSILSKLTTKTFCSEILCRAEKKHFLLHNFLFLSVKKIANSIFFIFNFSVIWYSYKFSYNNLIFMSNNKAIFYHSPNQICYSFFVFA